MTSKQQIISLDGANKLLVNSAEFEYTEELKTIQTYCGDAYVPQQYQCSGVIESQVTGDLHNVFLSAFGGYAPGPTTVDGLSVSAMYFIGNTTNLFNVLEGSVEHQLVSCNSLTFRYPLGGQASCKAEVSGMAAGSATAVLDGLEDVVATPSTTFSILMAGYDYPVRNLEVIIKNTFREYTCVDGSPIGKLLVSQEAFGEIELVGNIKSLQASSLSVHGQHILYCPNIRVTKLSEKVEDTEIYTVAEFIVTGPEVFLGTNN